MGDSSLCSLLWTTSNTLLAQIAHYFLLIPWFSKEIQICGYIVCRSSHCPLSHSLSSTYWTCSTGAKLRRLRVSRTQSASGKTTVRQWENEICSPIDSKQPEHVVPHSIWLAHLQTCWWNPGPSRPALVLLSPTWCEHPTRSRRARRGRAKGVLLWQEEQK